MNEGLTRRMRDGEPDALEMTLRVAGRRAEFAG